MTPEEKKSYLLKIKSRYNETERAGQGKILDEFCAVCGYNRKYAIRLLNKPLKQKQKKPGPAKKYGHEIAQILRDIWLASDQMCSKRLKATLHLWLPFYESKQGLLPPEMTHKLQQISPSSIDRLLRKIRIQHSGRGLSGTKPGTLLKTQIPIKTNHWDVAKPGFVEADTVAHCGQSLAGDFIWSLTFTDIYSCWTENRATWNKGAAGVIDQINDIEKLLPFDLLGFDCDNGSEFLNHHLLRYLSERSVPVQFTRSRPYHKNDNAHVEQKNWSHVRQLLGYYRLDNILIRELLNDLYRKEWSQYQNHFCPTMKLVSKEKVNSKYRKKYDTPKTPYERLITSEHLSPQAKKSLQEIHMGLNPFKLKQAIELKLQEIFSMVKVTPIMRQRI